MFSVQFHLRLLRFWCCNIKFCVLSYAGQFYFVLQYYFQLRVFYSSFSLSKFDSFKIFTLQINAARQKLQQIIKQFGQVSFQLYFLCKISFSFFVIFKHDRSSPLADSPDNITQSQPSITAFPTSQTSALEGRGNSVMLSNI